MCLPEIVSMSNTNTFHELEEKYTNSLLELINQRLRKGPRSFGFEYEFMSLNPIDPEIMERLYSFMPTCGFVPDKERFVHSSGVYVTFEPGGQIEYHSIPFFSEDDYIIQGTLELIEKTNSKIHQDLDIHYIATGYIPGRANTPLCLKGKRYKNLHSRMSRSGSRGLEMMKGTASIHLHARICHMEELASLFARICKISQKSEFRMGQDRRDIWDNTDPSRCGMPYKGIDDHSTPQQVVRELVTFALRADDIGKNIPFYHLNNLSFDAFMYHLTTIFTDVRLNIKGPSFELRTLDSMPFPPFKERLKEFISMLNAIS